MKPSTECQYREKLERMVSAVLAAPAGPHTLETLADGANCSPFHFQRVYRAILGESPTATVRRIRLAEAAHRLASTDVPVTAIAFDAGYESSQAFGRAFRNFTHVAPGEFRIQQRSLAEERVLHGEGKRIRIIEHPTFEVAAVPHDGPIATIPLAFRDLQSWERGQAPLCDAPRVGIVFQDQMRAEKIQYFAGVRMHSPIQPKGAAQIHRVCGGRYAAVRLIGPYALIAPTFKTLIEQWLPQSGFCLDRRPALELYGRPSRVGDTKSTELLLPVV
jgi:AraC family transcriptional regulator